MHYETHAPIGELVRAARVAMQYSQLEFCRVAGLNPKTLRSAETGDTPPQDVTRERIEKTLGWRPGVMRELWETRNNVDFSKLTAEDLRTADMPNAPKVSKASDLLDEELISELAYRLRHLREK